MFLAYDIGNSDITMGLWNGKEWQVLRIPSRTDQPELFYGIKIRDSLLEGNVMIEQVDTIVISSVVPGLTDKIKNVVRSLFKREPFVMGPAMYDKLPIEVLNPYEIGSDLVANAMSAYTQFKKTCIVVDFGTALTFTTVSGKGKILGVSIVPGLRTAVRALSQNTAKLFDVPLEMPKSALGINTVTAIQSGIVIGYEGLVKSVVQSIRAELNEECPAIATGGLSFVITSLRGFFHIVDPQLTLNGLRIIDEVLSERKD